MKYLLLTGATGLLGEYLLRDLTRSGLPLAVVARRSGRRSAKDRIEDIFAKLEHVERRALRRPVVLEGDLHEPLLGLPGDAVAWIHDHCDTLLHNAASLQFIRDERSGEPYASNVAGTTRMLELCSAAKLRRLHHVSTAYVCGTRRGRITEDAPLDRTCAGNDYEASKIESEQMVRAYEPLDLRVIHRPAIIVGDHRTGYTSTFHGFYVPLQLCAAIRSSSASQRGLPPELLLQALGLTGNERKNYVPVDWISAAITSAVIERSDRFHDKAIHLAPRQRVSVAEMTEVIVSALEGHEPPAASGATSAQRDPGQLLEFFREQMRVYQAYWRDDPEFDTSNADALMPELPCPTVDHDSMLRLCRYALRTNFGARRTPPVQHPASIYDLVSTITEQSDTSKCDPGVGYCITGPGGGDLTYYGKEKSDGKCGDATQTGQWSRGIHDRCTAIVRLNRPTFDSLLSGDCSVTESIARGRTMIFHEPSDIPPNADQLTEATEVLVTAARESLRELMA